MKQVAVYDNTGKQTGSIDVASVTPEQYTANAYAVSVRSLRQGWRQGTVAHQTRGEVSLTNKKPWRQKGTGRARAGSARSPLWRGGGVVFGPTARVRSINISRKQRQLALRATLDAAISSGHMFCLDVAFDAAKPSTKTAYNALKSVGLDSKKVVVFLSRDDAMAGLSFNNLPNVFVVPFDQPNVFDLSNAQSWVFLKKDENLFTDMVAKWN